MPRISACRSARLVFILMCACGGPDLTIREGCPDAETMKVDIYGACVCKASEHLKTPDGESCAMMPLAARVFAGGSQSCAQTLSGELICWGRGLLGALPTDDLDGVHTPRVVPLPGKISDVALGDGQACAALDDGSVHCWGANPNRQPSVVSLPQISSLCVGGSHACALSVLGSVHCWGANGSVQLGVEGDDAEDPVLVPIAPVRTLACGLNHNCAVHVDGGVSCWGRNDNGQLGNDAYAKGASPERVIGLPGPASAVAAGWTHSCAVVADGDVYCWGRDADGQLGDGSRNIPQFTAVRVVGLPGRATDIEAGSLHGCALLERGDVACWGSGGTGQLGTGRARNEVAQPGELALIPERAQDMAAGDRHTCAVGDSGAVYCWGHNRNAELGIGAWWPSRSLVPVRAGAALSDDAGVDEEFEPDCTCLARPGLEANPYGDAACCDGCYPENEGSYCKGDYAVCEAGECKVWGEQEACTCSRGFELKHWDCCDGCFAVNEGEGCDLTYPNKFLGVCYAGSCI